MIVQGSTVGEWVALRVGDFFNPACMSAIGWQNERGQLTAGVTYRDWNGASIEAAIAADKPLTRSFVRAIFDYPFRQLQARKLIVTTTLDNHKSVNLLTKMGFITEARLRDAAPSGDVIISTMRREDCRYLQKDLGHGKTSLSAAGS